MPHIVVARCEESLDWTLNLPSAWRVTVYNAGAPLDSQAFAHELQEVRCPGITEPAALMAEAVLRQLQAAPAPNSNSAASGTTVFCSGEPLLQAPNLIELLAQHERFAAVQPLSAGTGLAAALASDDRRDWIDDLAVRAERYSLITLAPLACVGDAVLRAGRTYRRKHALPEGANLLAHFLSLAGLERLATQARHADLGLYASGPVFAVSAGALRSARAELLPHIDALRLLARADHNYPEIFLHAWLHLFGLPFISLAGLALPSVATRRAAAPAMSRVVASIDAVLAQARPARVVTPVMLADLPVLRTALPRLTTSPLSPRRIAESSTDVAQWRERAQHAAANGDLHGAWQWLEQALAEMPRDVDLLADATALAYRQGDTDRALHCARRALAVDPQHLDCQFTLGMCLAASGAAEEALEVLAQLADHPQARDWSIEGLGGSGTVADLVQDLQGQELRAAPAPGDAASTTRRHVAA
ncbi:MAG: tetratricopeptide repeat protein [Burkholderiales bacterium]